MSAWPEWLPFVGVRQLSHREIVEFGLDTNYVWRGLLAEWFGRGYVLLVFANGNNPIEP